MSRTVFIPAVAAREQVIDRCYHECHYFRTGGHGDPMECRHPDTLARFPGAYENCIINHPDCDNGFPELCPLK